MSSPVGPVMPSFWAPTTTTSTGLPFARIQAALSAPALAATCTSGAGAEKSMAMREGFAASTRTATQACPDDSCGMQTSCTRCVATAS